MRRLFDAIVRHDPHPWTIHVLVESFLGGWLDRDDAGRALCRIGLPVAEDLLERGATADERGVGKLAGVLASMGEGVLPLLLDAVRSHADGCAIAALGEMAARGTLGEQEREAARALTYALADRADHRLYESLGNFRQSRRIGLVLAREDTRSEIEKTRLAALAFLGARGEASVLYPLALRLAARRATERLDAVSGIRAFAGGASNGAILSRAARLLRRAMSDNVIAVKLAALEAFAAIRWPAGTVAASTLRAALADPSAEVRRLAVPALARFGPMEALPALARLLERDSDEQVRLAVIAAFGRPSNDLEPEARPALCEATRDPSQVIRCAAVFALNENCDTSPDTIPFLFDVLEDETRREAGAALWMLGYRHPVTQSDLDRLHAGLVEASPLFWRRLDALERHGYEFGPEDAPLLARKLLEPEAWVDTCARQLGRIGSAALPHLLPLLEQGGEAARRATLALAEMGTAAGAALPRLRAMEGWEAAFAVGMVGDPVAGVAKLKSFFGGDQEGGAVSVMWRLTPASAAALPEMLRMVREGGMARHNYWLNHALNELAKHTPEVEAGLVALIREGKGDVDGPISTLSRISKRIGQVLPELLAILERGGQGAQEAAWAITEIGPEAASAVPALIHMLDIEPADRVRGVIEALASIGTAAAPAVPRLEPFVRHESESIRWTAAQAIERIRGKGASQQQGEPASQLPAGHPFAANEPDNR